MTTTYPNPHHEFRTPSKSGDVVLSIVGTIGKVALVPPELEGGNITQSSVRVRALPGIVLPEFTMWFLRSPSAARQYDKLRLGTGVPRLNVGDVRELVVPIPPLQEQTILIERLSAAMQQHDSLSLSISSATEQVALADRSIVSKAFRGELVPQDPNDEPASVLLERIRRERSGVQPKRGRRAHT